MLDFVGVGDLHLDSKLKQYIPNINQVIRDEVERGPIAYARRNGIRLVVFYGDICDVPQMSDEAAITLFDIFSSHPEINFVLITGNHDVEQEGIHSLKVLKKVCELGYVTNVRIIDKPTTLFRKKGTPVRFLPWPHFSVEEGACNVLHVEVKDAFWDHGKSVKSDRVTEHFCVSGHLHTKQVVGPKRNVHYCGTLYQTSFGERPDKYFHHVIVGPHGEHEARLVPHKPAYTLHNLVVTCVEDLDKIKPSLKDLYKVFVKDGAGLDAGTFDKYPNVVKINPFKSKQELDNLIAEELILHDASATVNQLTVLDALKTFMVRSAVEKSLAERAEKVFNRLVNRGREAST